MEPRSRELFSRFINRVNSFIRFPIEDFCFKEQIEFIQDPTHYKTAVCSRRAGKTVACAAHLIAEALAHPKAKCLYITLTRLNAKRIIWEDLLDINRTYTLGGVPNETELVLRFPNGSSIFLAGANDKSEIEKFRGLALRLVYLDECFHGETLVHTSKGKTPIKEIQVGDLVLGALGMRPVTAISVKKKDKYAQLRYGGKHVKCSTNHPFFTSHGWVKAAELRPGDLLARQDLSMWLLRSGVREAGQMGLSFLREQLLSEVSEKAQQPYGFTRNSAEDVPNAQATRSSPDDAWREWLRTNRGGESDHERSTGHHLEPCDLARSSTARLSDLLQSGPSISRPQDSDRGGRELPLLTKEARREENTKAGFIRLDGIEILECSGDPTNPGGLFYDLTVEGHPSFTVEDALVHNCQSFPSFIEELVDQVLSKSLFDFNGSLCLIGTPGPVPVGYFYQCSVSSAWSHHSWTMFQNPHLERKSGKTQTELVQADCERMGVTLDAPKIQRECYGRWVHDPDSLVFRYNAGMNNYAALPKANFEWNYVFGVDLGFDDADAIAILGWQEHSKDLYLIHEEVKAKQGLTELFNRLDELLKIYPAHKLMVDSGALGKKIADEMQRRRALPVHAAEKVRKLEFIELLNDAMRTKHFFAKSTGQFAMDCLKVEWDNDAYPPRSKISERFHSDICDATLYAFREALHWLEEDADQRPRFGTTEWNRAQERAHEEAAAKEIHKEETGEAIWGDARLGAD